MRADQSPALHLVESARLDEAAKGTSKVRNGQLAQTVQFDNGDVNIKLIC
jgi:hypothetical protein